MSPRFDRRPDKRAGSGGSSASRSPRPGTSRPSGSSPRPTGSRYQSRREDGPRPERRSGERPSSDRRSPEWREGDRRTPERRFSEPRSSEQRSSGQRFSGQHSGEQRFSERRPQSGRPPLGSAQDRRSSEGRFSEGRLSEGRYSSRGGGSRGESSSASRLSGSRFSGSRLSGTRLGGSKFSSSRFSSSRGERRPAVRGSGDWGSGERGSGERSSAERRPDSWQERRSRPIELAAGPLGGAAPTGDAQTHAEDSPSDLIWGRHPALAALESGRPVHRIWCTPEMRFSPKFLQLLREAKASGVLVEEVTWARLGQITGGAVHQGIVLQTAAAETLDLPSLIEGCRQLGEAPVLMALDGITDPHNLGAIVRSAEALGAHGVVLPQRRSAGLTGSAAKVAAGALEHLPVARVVNLNRALDSLKQEGYRVIGLAGEGTVTLEEADLDGPLVIVTGSEGEGLSMLTRRHCDQLVRIPLRGSTPSLNASVATALLLYEVARRGWMKGLQGSQPAPRISRPQLPSTPELLPRGDEPEATPTLLSAPDAAASPDAAAALPPLVSTFDATGAARDSQVGRKSQGLPAGVPPAAGEAPGAGERTPDVAPEAVCQLAPEVMPEQESEASAEVDRAAESSPAAASIPAEESPSAAALAPGMGPEAEGRADAGRSHDAGDSQGDAAFAAHTDATLADTGDTADTTGSRPGEETPADAAAISLSLEPPISLRFEGNIQL